MKKLLIILLTIMPFYAAHCDDDINVTTAPEISEQDIIPVDVLLEREPDATECSTAVFANALAEKLANVPEDTPESDVATLIHTVFSNGPTLERVIACPEIANADETDDIRFMPIQYNFNGGREIVINYETQPKILKQRLTLANKTSLPGGDVSPRIGDLNDPSIWTYTDPAWYGILITEAGALSQFVGNGKNNTISLKYIEDNIESLKPQNGACYSESALANDNKVINLTGDRTTGVDQDYYIAGDVNLQWISYLEIGLDVVITVVTFGGGAVISGVTKSARAARAMHNLSRGMRALAKTESVTKYIQKTNRIAKLTAKAKNLKRTRITALDKDLERATKQLSKMKPGSKKHIAQQSKVDNLKKQVQALDDLARDPDNAAAREIIEKSGSKTARQSMNHVLQDGKLVADPNDAAEIEKLTKEMRELEKTDKNVKQWKKSRDAFSDLYKYSRKLRLMGKPAQRGNVATRTLRYIKAANTGGRKINRANDIARDSLKLANKSLKKELRQEAKAAKEIIKNPGTRTAAEIEEAVNKVTPITRSFRAINGVKAGYTTGSKFKSVRVGVKNGRIRDWLFRSSMKNVGRLGRLEEHAGVMYGVLKFAGDMYDWSETSTGDYTSGIEFKPLLLLSADDIEGQENVVNHGMWLLWQGDTYSATDDDAAYLQAMDFAEKFYRDLLDIQDEKNDYSCNNIDIYVVRPIIRNPGDDNAELYYLIMNDVPWTTSGK